MKKIRAFIDWFFPLLAAHGATGSEICPQCGQSLTQGSTWQMVDGVAYHLHPGCAQQMDRSISMAASRAQEEDTGSYARGLLGALLGAIVGALVWALVLNLGYIAAIVGCIIGWLAERGYRLLHGKKGKGKIVILILSVLLGRPAWNLCRGCLHPYENDLRRRAAGLDLWRDPHHTLHFTDGRL